MNTCTHLRNTMQKNELRKDLIVDRYVIIAPHRNMRPKDTNLSASGKSPCGFCPERVDRVRDLYHAGPVKKRWRVKVIRNIFPVVSLDNPRAYGMHEVIIETPDHDRQLDDLPVPHIEELFRVYVQRTRSAQQNTKIQYIMIFKNSGGRAGASITHSHSQVFATDFIPPQLLDRSLKVQTHDIRFGECAYCTMISKEARGPRRIHSDKLITVFAPYASENNYEVWMFPKRHIDNVTQLTVQERRVFAVHLKRILRKIAELSLPYNFYFHQVVNDRDQHFYLKIRPRGSVWAGVEIGSGVIINPIPPEAAAKYYRS